MPTNDVPTPGRMIRVSLISHPNKELHADVAAVVTKVYDDGTINARCFSPMGGTDPFVTGLRLKDDPERNEKSDYWEWPART